MPQQHLQQRHLSRQMLLPQSLQGSTAGTADTSAQPRPLTAVAAWSAAGAMAMCPPSGLPVLLAGRRLQQMRRSVTALGVPCLGNLRLGGGAGCQRGQ